MNANDLHCFYQQSPSTTVAADIDKAIKKRKRCQHSTRFLYSQDESSRCDECGETLKRINKTRRIRELEIFKECDHFGRHVRFGETDDCCFGCGFDIGFVVDSMIEIIKNKRDRCFTCDYLKPVSKLNYWHEFWDQHKSKRERHYLLSDLFKALQKFDENVDEEVLYWEIVCDDCASKEHNNRLCCDCEEPLAQEEWRFKMCKKCVIARFN